MGGARHSARRSSFTMEAKLRQTIIATEWLLIDDELVSPLLADNIQLEYYEDGFPKLPTCLDLGQLLDFAQAA